MVDEVLEELRAIFREELEQQREILRSHRVTLLRDDVSALERQTSTEEIYRVAHSLKGAARAVGEQTIVNACHTLEDRLAPIRHQRRVDPTMVTEEVHRLLTILDEFIPLCPAPSMPESPLPDDDSDAPEAQAIRVQLEQVRRIGAVMDELGALMSGVSVRTDESEPLEVVKAQLHEVRRMLAGSRASSVDASGTLDIAIKALSTARRRIERRRRTRAHHEERLRSRVGVLSREIRRLRVTSTKTLALQLEQVCLEVAGANGKRIRFEALESDVLVDRDILERVQEPLLHLASNAVDHGIESPPQREARGKTRWGTIRFTVEQREDRIYFGVQDDGNGLDESALRGVLTGSSSDGLSVDPVELAFTPGLSTTADATTISGRGMGLAIARRCAREMHGDVSIDSQSGVGTTVTIDVPVEYRGFSALIAEIHGSTYVVPLDAVVQVLRWSPDDLRTIDGEDWLSVGESLAPVISLAALLQSVESSDHRTRSHCLGILLQRQKQRGVLWVDRLVAVRSIVARALHPRAQGIELFSSAVRAADGEVILVLDVGAVLGQFSRGSIKGSDATRHAPRTRRILVADDSMTTRQLVRIILESAGYGVQVAENGESAWQFLVRDASYDLVVSDLDMPYLDGLGLLESMRKHPAFERVPFIIVTARDDERSRAKATALGVSAYVLKESFDQVGLLDTIEQVLG